MSPLSSYTVGEVLNDHLVAVRVTIKPSTASVYQRYIVNHIAPYFGKTPCDELTSEMLQRFIRGLVENGLSAVTVQSIFSLLRAGLRSVVKETVLDVKLPRYTKQEMSFLSSSEQQKLEETAKTMGGQDYLTVVLCVYTGIRVGELCGLMWRDIDFERRLMHIRRTMQRIRSDTEENRTAIAFMSPKSATSVRAIPLSEFLISILRKHKSGADSEYVLSRSGKPIEPRSIQNRFKNILTAANVKEMNFHATRHTFAVRALEKGFDVKSLSEILGHASATVTLSSYAHALDDHKRRLMEKLTVLCQ